MCTQPADWVLASRVADSANPGRPVAGSEITGFYDPLVSKLSVWASDRKQAVRRMHRALSEYVLIGPKTNLAFHLRLICR